MKSSINQKETKLKLFISSILLVVLSSVLIMGSYSKASIPAYANWILPQEVYEMEDYLEIPPLPAPGPSGREFAVVSICGGTYMLTAHARWYESFDLYVYDLSENLLFDFGDSVDLEEMIYLDFGAYYIFEYSGSYMHFIEFTLLERPVYEINYYFELPTPSIIGPAGAPGPSAESFAVVSTCGGTYTLDAHARWLQPFDLYVYDLEENLLLDFEGAIYLEEMIYLEIEVCYIFRYSGSYMHFIEFNLI